MDTWFNYLKKGLSRSLPTDHIANKKQVVNKENIFENLNYLRPFIIVHWRKGAIGASLLFVGSLLGLPQPMIYRYLIDDVILNKQLDMLFWIILLQVVLSILGKLIGILQGFQFTLFEQEIMLSIQHDLFDRVLRFPKSFFDDKQVGYLMSRLMSDIHGVRWFFSSAVVQILNNIIRFIGGMWLLFYLEWRLSIGILLTMPVIILSSRYFAKKTRVLGHQSMEKQAKVYTHMQESLSSTSLIKSFASEKREASRMLFQLKDALQIRLEQMIVNSVANMSINSMPNILSTVILAVGAYWIIIGEWTLGSLLAFQSYVSYVYGPARFLANTNLQLQGAMVSLERVAALYKIVPEEDDDSGIKVERLKGEIEFKDVSFSYDGEQSVLQNVTHLIKPGEHVAIVGPSGVGKTTLISLIMNFYIPTEGEVLFDGLASSEYSVRSLRMRIGYVSQSTLLLSGTIRDNLSYGNPDASDDEIIQAAKTAGIDDFISSLPDGYNSHVGERGVNLSEGQKQRLSIARALIKDPDILVLDEPTASLDSIVEKSIFEALPAVVKNKTLFVIAHRLSTIQNSDCILLLNEHKLIATGTHQELLENNNYYRTLVSNQQVSINNNHITYT